MILKKYGNLSFQVTIFCSETKTGYTADAGYTFGASQQYQVEILTLKRIPHNTIQKMPSSFGYGSSF
jgi:hypothetical protein